MSPALPPELFDLVPEIFFFVKDRDHRFLRVNRALWEKHDCTGPEGMIGLTDWDFHPPALAGQYIAEDRRVMETGEPVTDQLWLVPGADGLPQWYLSSKIPTRDEAGFIIGVAGVMRPHDRAGAAPAEYARLTPAIDHVLQNHGGRVTADELAALAHLSVSQFQREFRRVFGMSPGDYLLEVRLQSARRRLERTNEPLSAVALECGFHDQSHFTKRFKAATGLRPLEYRRRFSARPPKL